MWGELSSEWGELSSQCGASCLGASFLWSELSWGELSLGRVVRNPQNHPLPKSIFWHSAAYGVTPVKKFPIGRNANYLTL